MGIPKNPYACAICQKSFPIAKSLLEHIKTKHESLYSSTQKNLNKDYDKVDKIKTKIIHEGNKPFNCELCDYRSHQKGDLKKHVATVHEGNKQTKRLICNEKRDTKNHNAAIHEVRKPFKCDICDYTCSRKRNLNRHVETVHEGNKPFKCNICEYGYSTKSILNKHIASVHY